MPSEASAIRRAAASQLSPCCWWYCGTFRIRQFVAWVLNVIAASAPSGLAITNAAAAVAATTTRRPREDSRRYDVRVFPSGRETGSGRLPCDVSGHQPQVQVRFSASGRLTEPGDISDPRTALLRAQRGNPGLDIQRTARDDQLAPN